LVHELEEEGQLEPILIVLDRDRLPGLSWGRLADCKLRAFLAIVNEVEVAIELHLNRSTLNTLLRRPVAGHEVWIKRRPGPKTRRLGEALTTRFSEELGNRPRGLRQKGFRVLEMLHKADIPAAILEPAFLSEDRAVSLEWRQGYRKATRRALYDYFTIDQEV
jgi:N-acetylmuramoyl-L-alanine amidase